MLNKQNFHVIKLSFAGNYNLDTAGSLLSQLDYALEYLEFTALEIGQVVIGDDSTDIEVFGYTYLEYDALCAQLNSALAKKSIIFQYCNKKLAVIYFTASYLTPRKLSHDII